MTHISSINVSSELIVLTIPPWTSLIITRLTIFMKLSHSVYSIVAYFIVMISITIVLVTSKGLGCC